MSKSAQETNDNLNKHYRECAPRSELFVSSVNILELVKWAQVTLKDLKALLTPLLQKSWGKFIIWWLMREVSFVGRHLECASTYKHLIIKKTFQDGYFDWTQLMKNVILWRGAKKFSSCFGFQKTFIVFSLVRLIHPCDQGTVQTRRC